MHFSLQKASQYLSIRYFVSNTSSCKMDWNPHYGKINKFLFFKKMTTSLQYLSCHVLYVVFLILWQYKVLDRMCVTFIPRVQFYFFNILSFVKWRLFVDYRFVIVQRGKNTSCWAEEMKKWLFALMVSKYQHNIYLSSISSLAPKTSVYSPGASTPVPLSLTYKLYSLSTTVSSKFGNPSLQPVKVSILPATIVNKTRSPFYPNSIWHVGIQTLINLLRFIFPMSRFSFCSGVRNTLMESNKCVSIGPSKRMFRGIRSVNQITGN